MITLEEAKKLVKSEDEIIKMELEFIDRQIRSTIEDGKDKFIYLPYSFTNNIIEKIISAIKSNGFTVNSTGFGPYEMFEIFGW